MQLADAVRYAFPFDPVAALLVVHAVAVRLLLRDKPDRAVPPGSLLARTTAPLRMPATVQLASSTPWLSVDSSPGAPDQVGSVAGVVDAAGGLGGWPVAARADAITVKRVFEKYGGHLLPQAFPEGGPIHPSYGSGHATVAGACAQPLRRHHHDRPTSRARRRRTSAMAVMSRVAKTRAMVVGPVASSVSAMPR